MLLKLLQLLVLLHLLLESGGITHGVEIMEAGRTQGPSSSAMSCASVLERRRGGWDSLVATTLLGVSLIGAFQAGRGGGRHVWNFHPRSCTRLLTYRGSIRRRYGRSPSITSQQLLLLLIFAEQFQQVLAQLNVIYHVADIVIVNSIDRFKG